MNKLADWYRYMQEMTTLQSQIKTIMYCDTESRNLTHDEFISKMRQYGCKKSSESISRARRKVWELNPNLKSTDIRYKEKKRSKEIGMRSWATLD